MVGTASLHTIGVFSGEGFVEHEEFGVGAEGVGDGEPAFFTAGEGDGEGSGEAGDFEAVEEFGGAFVALLAVEVGPGFMGARVPTCGGSAGFCEGCG